MKLSLRLLFLFLGVFFQGLLHAQANFTLDLNSPNPTDTSYYYNQSIPVEGTITYIGSGIYQGVLKLGYATFNTGNLMMDTVPGFSQDITLQNQEVAGIVTSIPVSPSFFLEGGGHTVIVWPILTPEPPNTDIDSVDFYVNILGWMNVTEWQAVKQARVYPVPATDYVMLEKPADAPIATLTVLDIKGSVLYTGKATETQTRISLDDLASGTYFIRYSDGVKPAEIHRFVKR